MNLPMEQMKLRIWELVRQIDNLNRELAEHWSQAQKLLTANDLDKAISILKAYFRLKNELEAAEARLEGTLKSQFADK